MCFFMLVGNHSISKIFISFIMLPLFIFNLNMRFPFKICGGVWAQAIISCSRNLCGRNNLLSVFLLQKIDCWRARRIYGLTERCWKHLLFDKPLLFRIELVKGSCCVTICEFASSSCLGTIKHTNKDVLQRCVKLFIANDERHIIEAFNDDNNHCQVVMNSQKLSRPPERSFVFIRLASSHFALSQSSS